MIQMEIIGNLGANAEVVSTNGTSFVSFRVAENRSVNGKESTTWVECTMNTCSEKLLQYLVKGQCVFARGLPRFRIFDSAKYHCKMVGVTLMVNELQLVGAQPKQEEQPENDPDGLKDTKPF